MRQIIRNCNACNTPTEESKLHVASTHGTSLAYCEDCLKSGRDSYKNILSYMAMVGYEKLDFNESYWKELLFQGSFLGKDEEDVLIDLKNEFDYQQELFKSMYLEQEIYERWYNKLYRWIDRNIIDWFRKLFSNDECDLW